MRLPDFLSAATVKVPAVGAVVASACFAANLSVKTAWPHGLFIAVVAGCFAVFAELLKPQALREGLAALGRWDLPRGFALLALALSASLFAVTSELTQFAQFRADDIAGRVAAIHADANAGEASRRSAARYVDLQAQLAAIAPHRSVADVQAVITKMLALNPKAGDCAKLDGPVSRAVCPSIVALNAEIDAARTAEKLRAEMAALPAVAAPLVADETADTSLVTSADPGASALAAALTVAGIKVAPATLSIWFVFVSVAALELSALFAGLLMPVAASEPITARSALPAQVAVVVASVHDQDQPAAPERSSPAPEPANPPLIGASDDASDAEHSIKEKVASRLRLQPDGLVCTTRALAAEFGCASSTISRAFTQLRKEGRAVCVSNSKGRGSALRGAVH